MNSNHVREQPFDFYKGAENFTWKQTFSVTFTQWKYFGVMETNLF